MHPARQLLTWLPEQDFALLEHRFLTHGRDYLWHIQDCLGTDPGEYEVVFTHCVQADCQTRVQDNVWPLSWDDAFLDYDAWTAAGCPDGYVWGTNWSSAYPGLTIIEDSTIAAAWAARIGRPFFEVVLETDRFHIRLVFHDIRYHKLSEATAAISAVTTPLKP